MNEEMKNKILTEVYKWVGKAQKYRKFMEDYLVKSMVHFSLCMARAVIMECCDSMTMDLDEYAIYSDLMEKLNHKAWELLEN